MKFTERIIIIETKVNYIEKYMKWILTIVILSMGGQIIW